VTIRESTISGNSAPNGGGIYFGSYRRPTEEQIVLLKTTISGNYAFDDGGGIWARLSGSSITLTDSILEDNIAGPIATAGGRGGAIYADLSNAAATISGSAIRGNSALAGGGAYIEATDTTVLITDSTVAKNHAFNGSGGGLQVTGDFGNTANTATIRNSTINGNSSSNGGGISASRIALTVDSSTISGNLSRGFGGGIFQRDAALYLSNATIIGNIVRQLFGGGGIHASGSSGLHASVNHSIVAGNFASLSAPSDIRFQSVAPSLTARYSLIGHNTGTGLTETLSGSPDTNGNLIGGPVHGVIDPLLGALADNGGPTMTHALLPGSPVINAGDPAAMAGVGDVPQFDQRGAPFTRVYGGRIDIGAFELQPDRLAGDYNFDGVVDAADVVVWRKTLNSSTDLRADGNGDGVVNQDDRQVWRANFGRTAASVEQGAESEERGAESTESAANQAPTLRLAWQPPALPGVSAASRAAFRPPTQRFEPEYDVLASLTSPRQMNSGRHDFANAPRQLMRETITESDEPSINAIDHVFETVGWAPPHQVACEIALVGIAHPTTAAHSRKTAALLRPLLES
jgi:hypothetical protein